MAALLLATSVTTKKRDEFSLFGTTASQLMHARNCNHVWLPQLYVNVPSASTNYKAMTRCSEHLHVLP
jgi:hypothetical protein